MAVANTRDCRANGIICLPLNRSVLARAIVKLRSSLYFYEANAEKRISCLSIRFEIVVSEECLESAGCPRDF